MAERRGTMVGSAKPFKPTFAKPHSWSVEWSTRTAPTVNLFHVHGSAKSTSHRGGTMMRETHTQTPSWRKPPPQPTNEQNLASGEKRTWAQKHKQMHKVDHNRGHRNCEARQESPVKLFSAQDCGQCFDFYGGVINQDTDGQRQPSQGPDIESLH